MINKEIRWKILLVGAGQLGSRYLQGLAFVNFPLEIMIVDPSAASLQIAMQRWSEANGGGALHVVCWEHELPIDALSFDLAIIATSASCRANVVKDISNRAAIKYWILEKVLTQSTADLQVLRESIENSEGCWVNIPRRLMGLHQSLKGRLEGGGPFMVERSGSLWGLACNAIHFIDLIAWWSGEAVRSIQTKGLKRHWLESKRLGFYETSGELEVTFSRGSTLLLKSLEDVTIEEFCLKTANGNVWRIDELLGVAGDSHGLMIHGALEYQSTITAPLIENIMNYGRCELPTFAESSEMHKIFLDAMLMHWNEVNELKDTRVPIT